jgi:hypothetical protein
VQSSVIIMTLIENHDFITCYFDIVIFSPEVCDAIPCCDAAGCMHAIICIYLSLSLQRFYAFDSMEGAKFESKCLMLQV